MCKKDAYDLIDTLKTNPTREVFAALHRIIIDYTVNPSSEVESTILFRLSIFRAESLPFHLQKDFEVLRETATYARIVDCEGFLESRRRDCREVSKDLKMVKILKYLACEGPEDIKEFTKKMGAMNGFQRTIEKGIDKNLILINNKSNEYPSLVSVTHKGRRVLRYLRTKE